MEVDATIQHEGARNFTHDADQYANYAMTRNAPSFADAHDRFGVLPNAQIVGACTPRTCGEDHSDSK